MKKKSVLFMLMLSAVCAAEASDFSIDAFSAYFSSRAGTDAENRIVPVKRKPSDTPKKKQTPEQKRKAMARRCYGKIRIVAAFEDFKVRIVMGGEDLRVRYVPSLARSPGQWEIVDAFEDFKVRFVDGGEDFTIRYVNGGEGVAD